MGDMERPRGIVCKGVLDCLYFSFPQGMERGGGFYTCQYHGGTYEAPGTCTSSTEVSTTIWHHDLICGLKDAVYARLSVHGTDTDYTDKAIKLEAALEERDAYGNLAWQNEDRIIWTDIDNREVSAAVRISGVVFRN